jgi:hypothetical protein
MIDYEDLKIIELRMNHDETELTIFLHGDGSIGIKQFAGLKRIMESGGFTHLSGSAEKGWIISKLDAKLRQSENDAILPQLKEP